MTNIPNAKIICTVSVMFVQEEDGGYATVLTEEGVRPFEADIVLVQAARHIMSHIEHEGYARDIEYRARHRRRPGTRRLH